MEKVTVTAPGHLHAGNMDLTGDLGRLYGTAGFTLEFPRTVLDVSKSSKVSVKGEDKTNAGKYVKEFIKAFDVSGGVELEVRESIPKHLGMGSQTALALSVGAALSELYDLKISLSDVALALGRSTVVGLGFHSFREGGFIVDGGYKISDFGKRIPPLLMRHSIPDDWVFVVCIPEEPIPEILKIKAREDEVLASLDRMPAEMSDRLSRIMLMKVMPSILEHDIESFGEAITAFNSRLGDFWEGFQRGQTYCHPSVEAAVNLMLDSGAYGACQTCWGPTCYGLVDSQEKAEELAGKLEDLMGRHGGGRVFYSKGNNCGASIQRW